MTIAMLQNKKLSDVVLDKTIIKINPKIEIISREAKHEQNINLDSKIVPSSIDVHNVEYSSNTLFGNPLINDK